MHAEMQPSRAQPAAAEQTEAQMAVMNADRDSCVNAPELDTFFVTFDFSRLFQSALVSAQSALSEEEEEEEHAGHLWLPQEPQPDSVQSRARV